MVRKVLFCVWAIFFGLPMTGCHKDSESLPTSKLSTTIPLVSPKSGDDLEQFVGKLITIRGKVSNTKIPQIEGIDVDIEALFLNEEDVCFAIGILTKTVVKPEDVDNRIANRGAGTFYSLNENPPGKLAKARLVKK